MKTGLILILIMLSGCATIKTEMSGASGLEPGKHPGADPVDVLFVNRHLEQTLGLDAVPKLQNSWQIMDGYDDILLDATREFSNLRTYAAFTEFASDMADPERIKLRDSLMAGYEWRIIMEWRNEKSFARYFLGVIGSVLSAALVPVPYTHVYTLNVDVYDGTDRLVRNFQRSARTTKWVEFFLFPIYPFHTEKRKTEELYVLFLHDVFRQIDHDGILVPAQSVVPSEDDSP